MLKQRGRPEQAGRAIVARRPQECHFGAQMTELPIIQRSHGTKVLTT
jgi:hypothetical protein